MYRHFSNVNAHVGGIGNVETCHDAVDDPLSEKSEKEMYS